MGTAAVSSKVATPSVQAPSHLPIAVQKQWLDAYNKALVQARNDNPNNERAARMAATKAANQLQSVTPPTSAKEIDALADWQVIKRETRIIKGVSTRVCVTIDGRKYAFPVGAAPVSPAGPTGATGASGPTGATAKTAV